MNGTTSNGADKPDTEQGNAPHSGLGLDATLLLCESTAAVQATQRALSETQDKLSTMVTQHRAQGAEPQDETQNGQESGDR